MAFFLQGIYVRSDSIKSVYNNHFAFSMALARAMMASIEFCSSPNDQFLEMLNLNKFLIPASRVIRLCAK